MIKLDVESKLIVSLLEISTPLPSKILEDNDYNKMKMEFKKIVQTLINNYYQQFSYQNFLKYDINEKLEFITISDPGYKEECFDKYGRILKNDNPVSTYTNQDYKYDILLCEQLLYRVRDSYNNLDEVEKFIIKCFEFNNPPKYTDESIMEELGIYKDKYYDSKKSAYIKMGIQLGLNIK